MGSNPNWLWNYVLINAEMCGFLRNSVCASAHAVVHACQGGNATYFTHAVTVLRNQVALPSGNRASPSQSLVVNQPVNQPRDF
jgi:hypothetical protein